MKQLLINLLDILSIELAVLLTATLPIIELRGAIPVGISLGLGPIHSAILSFIGSIIPVPFILFGIRPVFNYMKKTKIFRKLVNKLTNKSFNKSGKIQKYGVWGLLLFVSIPLPGTGVWSGSLAAALLNIRFKWAFPTILIGNFVAGIIVMIVSYGIGNIFTLQ